MFQTRTYYDDLQIQETASQEVIKGAYRYLSQKWHPDRNLNNMEEADRMLKIINNAYAILSDPIKRKEYDNWIVRQREEIFSSQSKSPYQNKSLNESSDDFYKAIIGNNNQVYYLRIFKNFDKKGRVEISWNWSAFFVSFYWFLYRKMWRNALIYFFLPYFVAFIVGLVLSVTGAPSTLLDEVLDVMSVFLYLPLIFLVVPMFANGLYYQHCNKKIIEAKLLYQDKERQINLLRGNGGTSNIVGIIVAIFAAISIAGILAAIIVPVYYDSRVRVQVAEAVSVGNYATQSVSQYYYQNQMIPSDLKAAGFSASLPPSVKNITVDSQNGVITVTMASVSVEGNKLLFLPSLDASNEIVWRCMSQEIPAKYLPSQCRQ
jgi:type II secretory pathway pseudopilin PulG